MKVAVFGSLTNLATEPLTTAKAAGRAATPAAFQLARSIRSNPAAVTRPAYVWAKVQNVRSAVSMNHDFAVLRLGTGASSGIGDVQADRHVLDRGLALGHEVVGVDVGAEGGDGLRQFGYRHRLRVDLADQGLDERGARHGSGLGLPGTPVGLVQVRLDRPELVGLVGVLVVRGLDDAVGLDDLLDVVGAESHRPHLLVVVDLQGVVDDLGYVEVARVPVAVFRHVLVPADAVEVEPLGVRQPDPVRAVARRVGLEHQGAAAGSLRLELDPVVLVGPHQESSDLDQSPVGGVRPVQVAGPGLGSVPRGPVLWVAGSDQLHLNRVHGVGLDTSGLVDQSPRGDVEVEVLVPDQALVLEVDVSREVGGRTATPVRRY